MGRVTLTPTAASAISLSRSFPEVSAPKPDLRHRLEETLQEEEAMAAWFEDNLEAITRRFVELKVTEDRQVTVAKERVKQAENDASPTSDSQMSGTLWQQLGTPERRERRRKHPFAERNHLIVIVKHHALNEFFAACLCEFAHAGEIAR